MQEREAMAVLVSIPGISYGRREMALRAAGSALAVLQDPRAFAAQLTPAGAAAVRRAMREDGAQRTLDALAQADVSLLLRGAPGYPERLMQIPHPPHLLFTRGREALDDPFPVAIVGTRKASAYGLSHTREIARELAQAGVCVVSGLALGIDAAGHRGALDGGGRTIAVLGGALDRMYPAQNAPLMREIVDCGGSAVSEYPLGVAPTRYSFLHRNRIIAGLSLGVLVTEGARRSGALRTAQDALDYGREVFALPGSVDSVGSQLPHLLLSEGAHLAACARDILESLCVEPPDGAVRPHSPARTGQRAAAAQRAPQARRPRGEAQAGAQDCGGGGALPEGLSGPERAVCLALSQGEADFDELCARTGIPSEELGALLTMLDMDGVVEALSGLRYRLR